MIRALFFVWLSIVVATVAANPVTIPVTQKKSTQFNVYQSNPLQHSSSAPPNFQQVATQSNPNAQQVTLPNTASNQPGIDGAINQLLINKIFGNPGLQKILDPNTKLYNQNGQEIQRQPNAGSVPNVINNYFIVPPEFFMFNDTKTESISKSATTKRKNNSTRKANQTKPKVKLNVTAGNFDSTIVTDVESNRKPKNNGRIKNKERNRNQPSVKIIKEDVKVDVNTDKDKSKLKVNTKRKRKQGSLSKSNTPIISIPSPSDNCKEDNIDEVGVICPVIENSKPKRRKPSRKDSNDSKYKVIDLPVILDPIKIQKNEPLRNKNVTSTSDTPKLPSPENNDEKPMDVHEPKTSELNKDTHLKNIELPVENRESKDQEENRQTRNSKGDVINGKSKNGLSQKTSPNSDDIMKQFFPYLYMGNSFFPNSNFPFNLEQFYGPFFNRSNKKPKTRKTNKEQNQKKPRPKVIEVKLKPPKRAKEVTAQTGTVNPVSEKNSEVNTLEPTTLLTEPVINIPMIIPRKENLKNKDEANKEEEIPDTKSVATKANIEMPPTMIEDLQDYLIPELGREDIVPTIHTNALINDYYPTFHDDFHYTDDETYYLKDLEDDRHFYTTDHGDEELLNRERRKYDKYEDIRVPNLDIKDRINFRRGYKHRTKDFRNGEEISKHTPYERFTEREQVPVKLNEEPHFQIPPLLEHPDFKTKKVEIVSSKTDDSNEFHKPIYRDYLVEKVTNKPRIYYDIKSSPVFNQVHYDAEIPKDKVTANSRLINDQIETVFANSRVVKYGVAKDESEEKNPATLSHQDDSDKYYGDGHTTYVVAKSYHDDFYWK